MYVPRLAALTRSALKGGEEREILHHHQRQNIKWKISLKALSFWVIFLMARTIPPSFVEIGPKLRVVALLTRQWPKTAKNRGEPQKMTPSSETENFLGVVLMGKF